MTVRLAPVLLAPMHLCGDTTLPDRLARELNESEIQSTEVLRLSEPGQHHLFATGNRSHET
jgi:hypothetical protein